MIGLGKRREELRAEVVDVVCVLISAKAPAKLLPKLGDESVRFFELFLIDRHDERSRVALVRRQILDGLPCFVEDFAVVLPDCFRLQLGDDRVVPSRKDDAVAFDLDEFEAFFLAIPWKFSKISWAIARKFVT